jgi:hypothetical protein
MTSKSVLSLVPTERDLFPARLMFDVVTRRLAPFRPKVVKTWAMRDTDFFKSVIYVETNLFPGEIFKREITDNEFLNAYNPIHIFELVAVEAANFFGSIYVSPEAHIHLGEN